MELGREPAEVPRLNAATFNPKTTEEYVKYLVGRMTVLRGEAINDQKVYDENRKRRADKKRSDREYHVGDRVMFDASIMRKGNKRKLMPSYIGPYEVTKVANDGLNYDLRGIANPSINFKTRRKHLRLFHDDMSPLIVAMESLETTDSSLGLGVPGDDSFKLSAGRHHDHRRRLWM